MYQNMLQKRMLQDQAYGNGPKPNGAPSSLSAANARIAHLEEMLHCGGPAYSGMGVGQAFSRVTVRNDIGSIASSGGYAESVKDFTQVCRDDGTDPAKGADQVVTVSLDGDDQASFNGLCVKQVGFIVCASGDFPFGFDNPSLEDCSLKRGLLETLRGGSGGEQVVGTTPLITINVSSQFPKAGMKTCIIPMSGNFESTKWRVKFRGLPAAQAGQEYCLDASVLLQWGPCPEGDYCC